MAVPTRAPEQAETAAAPRPTAAIVLRRVARQHPMAIAGIVIIAAFVLIAIFAPELAPYNPTLVHLSQRLRPPSAAHPFGQDEVGMDVFSRVLYGARIDLLAALMVVVLAGSFGTAIGMAAGFFGGAMDEVLMRITDVFLAFPALILAMAISAVLKPDLYNALLAISVTWWPTYARLGRGQALALRGLDYIEAARSEGASTAKVLIKHMFPNAMAPLVVQATLDMGFVILTTAGLSFIGFGAQPPTPEWGVMVSSGRSYLMTQWWIATFPAVAMFLLVMGFNLVGDALRDVLDPRLRT